MAFDGIFLRHIKKEIEDKAIGARVDKIYQPSKEEIVLSMRNRNDSFKLFLSARANSARINFTNHSIENPKTPPMFCMLLRKKLVGAKLAGLRQPGLERIVYLDFDAVNLLGDNISLTLAVEIMGKYSNVILIDENGKISDSLKRVDAEMTSKRLVLPGVKYELPPAQNKISILNYDVKEISKIICDKFCQPDKISKSLLSTLQGVSPIVCREIEHNLILDNNSEVNKNKLYNELKKLKDITENVSGSPYIIIDNNGKPIDFSFININQYCNLANSLKRDSFSQLLEEFYFVRDSIERIKMRSHDLSKLLTNIEERLSRKINLQKNELVNSINREKFKICADLLNANAYFIKKGTAFVDLENFYDNMKILRVKLDPSLDAIKNAQVYYKKYRKATNAEKALKIQIEKAQNELDYIESIINSLSMAKNENELIEIKQELIEQGYIKSKKDSKNKNKQMSVAKPLEFFTSNGFKVLVGKNNRQNDKLTLKQAKKTDIWFHTKDIPGSHTILFTDGKTPDEKSIFEAAEIAAKYSKAANSSQVPVDYTLVKNVSKPQGAKPGMVIYVKNKTLYVTPKN